MSYEFTKLSEVPAVSEFPEGANAIIEANGEIKRCPPSNTPKPLTFTGAVTGSYDGSEALTVEIPSVPKPLTYDYMPEGYPSKSVQTTTLLAEQELAFTLDSTTYSVTLTNPFEISKGQTYTVNWDGTEYECVCFASTDNVYRFGNMSILGEGGDTGEPFLYTYKISNQSGFFDTLDTSASHTISVKTTEEIVTPMAEEFLPNIPADKLPTGANSTTVFYFRK